MQIADISTNSSLQTKAYQPVRIAYYGPNAVLRSSTIFSDVHPEAGGFYKQNCRKFKSPQSTRSEPSAPISVTRQAFNECHSLRNFDGNYLRLTAGFKLFDCRPQTGKQLDRLTIIKRHSSNEFHFDGFFCGPLVENHWFQTNKPPGRSSAI